MPTAALKFGPTRFFSICNPPIQAHSTTHAAATPTTASPTATTDTFPTIHQLFYALEHPLSPADTVKRHQPDDDDIEEDEHIDMR